MNEAEAKSKLKPILYAVGFLIMLFFVVPSFFKSSSNVPANTVVTKECEKYESNARVISKEFLKDHLEYVGSSHIPSTYESVGSFSCDGTTYNLRNWVDSANAFGALKRQEYIMSLKFKGGEWTEKNNWEELDFTVKP